MPLDQIVTQVLSIATPISAALVYILNERNKAKRQKKQDDLDEAERERSYSDRVSNRLKSAEETIERLTKELTEERLRHNKHIIPSDVLRDFIDSDPGVSWVKRRMAENEYIMIRCSKGYAKEILQGPPDIYDGKSDEEIWGKQTADNFNKTDEEVYKHQEGVHLSEHTPKGTFVGRKFPIRLPDGVDYIVGIGIFEKVGENGLLKFID